MSSRPDGQPSRHGLTPEDDWFASPAPTPSRRGDEWFAPGDEAPFDFDRPPATRDVPVWHDDEPLDDAPPPHGHGLGDRRWAPVVAAVGIVAVIAVAILVVRSLGGSDSGANAGATTAAITDTTAIDTTATDTTATDTTATDTTATDTTATDTTPATTSTTPATTTPTTTVTEVPTGQSLKPGMSGSSVLALQQALAQLGYDPGTPDGSYGAGTTQAVTAFQAANNLTQDGVAGPATLAAINQQIARG